MSTTLGALKPLAITVMGIADDIEKGDAPEHLWMIASIRQWDLATAEWLCKRGKISLDGEITDESIYKAVCAMAPQFAKDLEATGFVRNIMFMIKESTPASTYRGLICTIRVESGCKADDFPDLQDFCVGQFLDMFGGAARIEAHTIGPKTGFDEMVLTEGTRGKDAPAIGNGNTVEIAVTVRGETSPSTVRFNAASEALADLIRLRPLPEQSTPGARRDIAMNLVELEVEQALSAITSEHFDILIEDRSQSENNPTIMVYCDVDATSGVTSGAIKAKLVASDLGLFN